MRKLINLDVKHVAGVDRAANKRTFLVVKSADPVEKKREIKQEGKKFVLYEDGKKLGTYDDENKANFAMKTLQKSIYISSSKQVSVREEGGKFQAYGGDDNHSLGEFDTVDAAIRAATDFLAKGGSAMLTKEQVAKIEDEELQKAVLDQQKEILDLKEQNTELAKKVADQPPPKDPDEAMWKNVPPAIRNSYDAMKKREEAADKRATEERNERRTKDWIGKCAELKYLPAAIPETFAKVLSAVEDKYPTEVGEIYRVLRSANDVVTQSELFKELGRENGDGLLIEGDATTASARIDALARDMMKRDENLTLDAAIGKVAAEHPDWYELSKRQSQVRV